MKLGQREKNLLIIVGVIIVVFCSYFFGFRNIMAKNESVLQEVKTLTDRRNALKGMQAKVDDYIKDTEDYNKKIDDMYKKFDTGASQEYTIKFLEGIENSTNAWISNASLQQPEQIYTFGTITSSNPTTLGSIVYESDNVGYAVKSTLSFKTSYSGFKSTLDYILHNNYKCTLESLSVSYNAEEDIVSGSFVITQFAITGTGREFGPVYTDNPLFGTDNIFSSSIFDPEVLDEENGNDIYADYDIFLSLQSYESDAPALKMGFKTDSSKTIVNEDNDVQNVTLTITGEEGNYKVSYKVGNVTYPTENYSEGAEFVPGVKLSLLVNCSGRTSTNDVSGANMTIINDSDMTLHVKVINDDENDPRFKINDKQGDIVIYQD